MSCPSHTVSRRKALTSAAVTLIALPVIGCTQESKTTESVDEVEIDTITHTSLHSGNTMQIYYLEVVTQDVDAACKLHSAVHGVTFGDPDASLGGARVSKLKDGGMIGIRAPMHEAEKTVTRAYTLVKDIKAAVEAASESGATIAVPPMQLPGHGTCAVFIQDGIEAGFWQL
ncbi:MAG: hypothetical protein AAFV88_01405 [Planctomycetota bacterium]